MRWQYAVYIVLIDIVDYVCVCVCVLISEIEDLPNSVKKQLFDELLDANAQKGRTVARC